MSTYAKVVNGEVTKTMSKPKWFTNEGTPVTDEILIEKESLYPVIYNPPTIDSARERYRLKPITEWVVNETNVTAAYIVENKSLEEVKQEKINQLNMFCDERLESMSFEGNIVKIREDSPNKPRQSWLNMSVNRATIAVIRGEEFNEPLILADDSQWSMDANKWINFGMDMQSHVANVLFVKATKEIDINNLSSIDDIIAYNVEF